MAGRKSRMIYEFAGTATLTRADLGMEPGKEGVFGVVPLMTTPLSR